MDFNEEQIAFYSGLGLAVTQWAHVEFALAQVISACLSKKDAALHSRGLFSIENLRSKLRYADAIVTTHINYAKKPTKKSKKQLSDWVVLLDQAGNLAKKRNRLAHCWVMNDPSMNPGRRKMLLDSKPSNKKPTNQKYPGAICVRDISKYQLEFVALMTALENFACRLSGRKERFPKSLEQPKRPPTIEKLRRRIYAYAQHPPSPSRA